MKITHVMHRLNLNGSVLRSWFDFLIKQKLIEETKVSNKRVAYIATDRGKKFLKAYLMLMQMLPEQKMRKIHCVARQK